MDSPVTAVTSRQLNTQISYSHTLTLTSRGWAPKLLHRAGTLSGMRIKSCFRFWGSQVQVPVECALVFLRGDAPRPCEVLVSTYVTHPSV